MGLRLALAHPEWVTALITQNGNIYEEGLSAGWDPARTYWQDSTPENRAVLRAKLTWETTQFQYWHGTPDPTQVAPKAPALDFYGLVIHAADGAGKTYAYALLQAVTSRRKSTAQLRRGQQADIEAFIRVIAIENQVVIVVQMEAS